MIDEKQEEEVVASEESVETAEATESEVTSEAWKCKCQSKPKLVKKNQRKTYTPQGLFGGAPFF